MAKKRIRCTYPMSDFHNFEDEVLKGERVSTADDCEDCDIDDCENTKHCLIEELPFPHPCPDE